MVCTYIPVGNSEHTKLLRNKEVYLSTNGVHLSVQIPVADIPERIAQKFLQGNEAMLLGFGWGEANFLLHVPTWDMLDFETAATATLIPTASLMHVSRWQDRKSWMVPVPLSEIQLQQLINAIEASFTLVEGSPVLLPEPAFSTNDNFYQSPLSYHAFHTCNSWVNACFKKAGLDACLWTPFDFGLMRRYQE